MAVKTLLSWMGAQVWFDVAQGLLVGEIQELPGIAELRVRHFGQSHRQVIPSQSSAFETMPHQARMRSCSRNLSLWLGGTGE